MAGMELNRFITEHSSLTWSPGRVDCLLTLADWYIALGKSDAAAHLRGTYDSEEGFRAIVARYGGAIQVVQSCADRIGVPRIDTPRVGSGGVIGSVQNVQRQFGAIFDGENWLVRLEGRFVSMIAKPLAIWDVD